MLAARLVSAHMSPLASHRPPHPLPSSDSSCNVIIAPCVITGINGVDVKAVSDEEALPIATNYWDLNCILEFRNIMTCLYKGSSDI